MHISGKATRTFAIMVERLFSSVEFSARLGRGTAKNTDLATLIAASCSDPQLKVTCKTPPL